MGVSTLKVRLYYMSKLTHDNKHLTLDERKIIQTGIENRSRKINIARTIGKDPTTVAKEIRKHIIIKQTGSKGKSVNNCINRNTCLKKRVYLFFLYIFVQISLQTNKKGVK